jgi:hypothetical protein
MVAAAVAGGGSDLAAISIGLTRTFSDPRLKLNWSLSRIDRSIDRGEGTKVQQRKARILTR